MVRADVLVAAAGVEELRLRETATPRWDGRAAVDEPPLN